MLAIARYRLALFLAFLFVVAVAALVTGQTGATTAPDWFSPNCKGMTWRAWPNHANGYQEVGSDLFTNAYEGDTPCSEWRPILCLNQDGAVVPPDLEGVIGFYHGWAAGNMAITPLNRPVRGTALTSREAADNLCAAAFGEGWRMAEFHDGVGGWNWYAYGNIASGTRFWTANNDQPANPWDYFTQPYP